MPYIKSIVVAGKTIEVEKYHSSRYGRKLPRGPNQNPTPAMMEKLNIRNSTKQLRRGINANFRQGDLHLSCTYADGKGPSCEEGFKSMQVFFRLLRAYCKKHNIELKYIWVTGIGKKGALHHHVVMNYIDLRVLQSFWPHGKIILNGMLDNSGEYSKLAEYLYKNYKEATEANGGVPPHKRKYNASKTIVFPKPKRKIIKKSDLWRKEPKALKGYIIPKDSIFDGVDGVTGCPYQYYTMVKIE